LANEQDAIGYNQLILGTTRDLTSVGRDVLLAICTLGNHIVVFILLPIKYYIFNNRILKERKKIIKDCIVFFYVVFHNK